MNYDDKTLTIRQGDIVYADIPDTGCSIQCGKRPVIVVSNNRANMFSPVIHVVPLTSHHEKKRALPTHKLILPWRDVIGSLRKDSMVLCEQIVPINKDCIIECRGRLTSCAMERVLDGILVQFGIKYL